MCLRFRVESLFGVWGLRGSGLICCRVLDRPQGSEGFQGLGFEGSGRIYILGLKVMGSIVRGFRYIAN